MTVIAREGGRSSIPEAAVIDPRGRSVPDPPHARRRQRRDGLRRGACHRARVRATRWLLAMTAWEIERELSSASSWRKPGPITPNVSRCAALGPRSRSSPKAVAVGPGFRRTTN